MASLGHAACFGLAAYGVGLLSLRLGWTVWTAMPAALTLSALVALIFGFLATRSRGSYFLMITLALSQLIWGVAFGWRSVTGGSDGLPAVPRPDLSPFLSVQSDTGFYYFSLLIVALASLVLVRMTSSPFGYALRGIRESETRMLALGYNVWRYRLLVFVISGFFAALAGVLYAYFNRFVSPDYLHVERSAEVLLMVILGGAGTLIGPAFGAVAFVTLENFVSAYTDRWVTILGIIYMTVALFAPDGMVGLVRRLRGLGSRS
jgi:branched-chain amino acid transport system permease protein